jgi:hypothetical protein
LAIVVFFVLSPSGYRFEYGASGPSCTMATQIEPVLSFFSR